MIRFDWFNIRIDLELHGTDKIGNWIKQSLMSRKIKYFTSHCQQKSKEKIFEYTVKVHWILLLLSFETYKMVCKNFISCLF